MAYSAVAVPLAVALVDLVFLARFDFPGDGSRDLSSEEVGPSVASALFWLSAS